jgi:hypothetical protein
MSLAMGLIKLKALAKLGLCSTSSLVGPCFSNAHNLKLYPTHRLGVGTSFGHLLISFYNC